MTPQEALAVLTMGAVWTDEQVQAANVLRELVEGAPELARLRAMETRARRVMDMPAGVALPGSKATALAILEGP